MRCVSIWLGGIGFGLIRNYPLLWGGMAGLRWYAGSSRAVERRGLDLPLILTESNIITSRLGFHCPICVLGHQPNLQAQDVAEICLA